MYILKLPWLNHSEESHKHEVYSVSISPDGSRLASGGLDGNVRIWSTKDILKFRDPTAKRDDAVCRPLCSMARHTGAVTVVRFSPDGRFLATGSDDKVLLIWERDEENRPAFGEQNLEHWTVTKRAVAHDNDIEDIAWAPDSSILVSVGLDRSIIIWSGSTFEKIKRFDVHQSHVKGVVFDPANKYFATSSDDRSVRIFRYHKGSEISFSIERTVLKPFKKSPLTTYYRRISWSPDGQFIAAPNATNGPVTSVAIITRGSWDSDISLIGHDSPCEVASFSPVLYEVPDPNDGKLKKVTSILATAGQDKNLVIWDNAYSRAIAVFEEFAMKTITDLCWSPDGLTLYASALDGTISAIRFEEGELGTVVSSEKNNELLNKYGVDKDSMVFPESTEQLILEDKSEEFSKTLSEKHMDRLLRLENTSSPTPKKQEQNYTKLQHNSEDRASTKQVTRRQLQDKTKLHKVVVTNGKKRVAPTLISTSSHSINHDSKFQSGTLVTPKKTYLKDEKVTRKLSMPSYNLPKFGVQTAVNPYYIKKTSMNEEEEEDEGDEIAYEEAETPEELITKRRRLTTKQNGLFKLRTPPDDCNIMVKCLYDMNDERKRSTMEILNQDEHNADDPSIIIVHQDGELIFEHYVSDRVLAITGQYDKYWALATDNGALITFTPSGRILQPRIELGASISHITSKENVIMIVTDDYMVHCFDLIRGRRLHKKVSLAPILNYDDIVVGKKCEQNKKLLDIELLDNRVVVFLNNNDVYLYDSDLKTWTRILEQYYNSYNTYDAVWVDRLTPPREPITSGEERYINKLTFLESYETIMKRYFKHDPQRLNEITKDITELIKSDLTLYSQVRGNN